MLSQSSSGAFPPAAPRSTIFHCTNREEGDSILSPAAFEYGPAQGLQLLSGSDVLPERAKNSTRAPFPLFVRAAFCPHHCRRPQRVKSFASNGCDSNEPSASLSGPRVRIFPGFAAARNSFPPGPDAMAVTCPEAVLTRREKM